MLRSSRFSESSKIMTVSYPNANLLLKACSVGGAGTACVLDCDELSSTAFRDSFGGFPHVLMSETTK